MKPSEVIKQYGWCKGHFALDNKGLPVGPVNKNAASFCLLGAIQRAYANADLNKIDKVITNLKNASKELYGNTHSLVHWNDYLAEDKDQVINLLEYIGE
jgi:hypothetical protein